MIAQVSEHRIDGRLVTRITDHYELDDDGKNLMLRSRDIEQFQYDDAAPSVNAETLPETLPPVRRIRL